jgi:hypothetical protein
VVGSGDYSGDGKSDILIRNDSTGVLGEYQMNGTTIAASGEVTSVPAEWEGWPGSDAAKVGAGGTAVLPFRRPRTEARSPPMSQYLW